MALQRKQGASNVKERIKLTMAYTVARRNPVAVELRRDGQFRSRVINGKRAYRRRDRNNKGWE